MKMPNLSGLLSDYSRRQKKISILIGLSIGIFVAIIYFCFQDRSWLRFADNLVQQTWMDKTFEKYGTSGNYVASGADFMDKTFAENLVLLVFDDSTLRSGISWPIKRSLYLDLVKKLEIAGAKTIAFDIIFSGPSQSDADDMMLREAIEHKSVVFPYGLSGSGHDILDSKVYPKLLENWTDQDFETRYGFSLDVPDPIDKRVRLAVLKVEPQNGGQGGARYALNVVALAHYLGVTPQEIIDKNASKLTEMDLALAGSSNLFKATVGRIAYFGSDLTSAAFTGDTSAEDYKEGEVSYEGTETDTAKIDVPPISDFIQVVPVQDILNTPDADLPGFFGKKLDPATGKEVPNKVMVLIGVNVPGGHDIKLSEVGTISGVGIHANIMWDLIQGTFLKEIKPAHAVIFILVLSAIASLMGALLDIRLAAAGFAALIYATWLTGYNELYSQYWTKGGTLIPIFVPVLGALASFGAVTIYNVRAQKTAKDKFAKILQEVAPIPNLEELLGSEGLEIGSKERTLTILFSDIRGYTDLSENLDPVTITEMLNTYHGAMGEIFERYGGVIFDYQGDAQMVVFGLVPASQPNHAAAACKAASGMVLKLARLREQWLAQNRPVFESGIGVCTGQVAIGILGSSQRKQYAAIGDPTNTAARMQGKSKELHCPVLITESTYLAAGDEIIASYIDSVSVKGKKEPLRVYGVDSKAMEEQKGVIA